MRSTLFASLLTIAACSGSGSVRYQAQYSTPELVEIEPGVQVIADYDEPVFYSDNFYWRYDGGVWYRSRDYRRDWVRVERPTARVARIARPGAYVHYRADVRAEVRDDRRDHRDDRRPDRVPSPPPPSQAQPNRPMPAPLTPAPSHHWQSPPDQQDRRELREERKDERREERQERKERKEDRKDDRRNDRRNDRARGR